MLLQLSAWLVNVAAVDGGRGHTSDGVRALLLALALGAILGLGTASVWHTWALWTALALRSVTGATAALDLVVSGSSSRLVVLALILPAIGLSISALAERRRSGRDAPRHARSAGP
jgi:hypothetical protein